MNQRTGRINTALAVAALAALAAAGTGAGLAQGTPDERSEVREDIAQRHLGDDLSLFERAQRPDEVEQGREAQRGQVPDLIEGENLGLVRRVDLPAGPVSVWPARDAVCHGYPGGSGCAPVAMLEREGVIPSAAASVTLGPGVVVVGGLARDGVESVTIEIQGRDDVAVPVTSNVFLERLKGVRPVAVRWSDSRGDHRLPLGLPGDAHRITAPDPRDRID